jgi:hypothetical protein
MLVIRPSVYVEGEERLGLLGEKLETTYAKTLELHGYNKPKIPNDSYFHSTVNPSLPQFLVKRKKKLHGMHLRNPAYIPRLWKLEKQVFVFFVYGKGAFVVRLGENKHQ